MIIVRKHIAEQDSQVSQAVWDIYEQAFEASLTSSVQDQACYTQASLTAAVADPEHVLFTAWTGSTMVGFTLGTFNMEKARVAYVNPRYLELKFPEEYASKRLCYFTALGALPQYQGLGVMDKIVAEVTEMIDAMCGIIVFDFSDKLHGLPKAFQRTMLATQTSRALKSLGTEYESLGSQSYGAIRFKPRP